MTIVWLITLFLLWLALVGVDHQTTRANRAEGEADEWRRRFNEARGDQWLSRIDAWRNGIANECRVIEGDFELTLLDEPTPEYDNTVVDLFKRQLDEGRTS